MPVPKRKVSRARRDKRQANKGIKPQAFATCLNCVNPIAPHQVCIHCGFYKGKKILVTKTERALKRGEVRTAMAERKATREGSSADNSHEGHNHDSQHGDHK